VNAAHMANVPGRKTDGPDGAWIAHRLECGLRRGSFVPAPAIRALRDLPRDRTALIQDRTREANRLHTVRKDAGIKRVTRGERQPRRLGTRHAHGAGGGDHGPPGARRPGPRSAPGDAPGLAAGPHRALP